MNEKKYQVLDSIKNLKEHISSAEELVNHTIDVNNKQSEAPILNNSISSEDLIPANILSEPRYAAFGAGPLEVAQSTVTETMSKSVKNTVDKVDTVSSVSSDKKEGTIKDGYKPTLKKTEDVNSKGAKALQEAKGNVEGGNGVALVSNTEVQLSSFNTFSINSGRVGTIQSPLLVSQASSNIDYSETKTVINNLQSERSRYRYAESDRDINITNKDLRVAQSSEERVLRKSMEAVQSYDETSALIARNSERDTTITDYQESFVTDSHIQQAQKGGIHFIVGNSAPPSNSPALFRPILPGEFNPMEQILWSMTGGKIEATSTQEFNLKTAKSNTTADNIGLIAKGNLSSIAFNNGIYGDITTMIGKKALSTGTDIFSMTTMIGKFTFMGGFLSLIHQVLDSDISRIAQIILPRIKLPTNLPIPPLPAKSSAYTETDLRKCLPTYEDDTIDQSSDASEDVINSGGYTEGPDNKKDGVVKGKSQSINKQPKKSQVLAKLNKEKATNNEIIPTSSSSGPPSSVSWRQAQTSTETTVSTTTSSSSTNSLNPNNSSTNNQTQARVGITHKIAFSPNTYLEIYQPKPPTFNNFNEPPVDDPNSSVKSGIQSLTLNYINEKLKVSNLSTIDKKILEDKVKAKEIFEALQKGNIPNDLNNNQKTFLKEVLDSLSITIAIGLFDVPGIIKSIVPDTISRFMGTITQVGDSLFNKSNDDINKLISNLKEGSEETLIGIGKSALNAIQSGDITGVETNINNMLIGILKDYNPITPTFPTQSTDGNILRDIIIPPELYEQIAPSLTKYILEPNSSIESTESLIKNTLRDFLGNKVDDIESLYKRISPLIDKVKKGDILDLLSKGNIRNTVSTIGGQSLVRQIDSVINNIESLIGTARAIEAIPALIKLMNEENIPTLSQVSTILSCLDIADRISDLIGIVKDPFNHKPIADIPNVFDFFDAEVNESISSNSISTTTSQQGRLNPYMDTAIVSKQVACKSPKKVTIPSDELIRSNINVNITDETTKKFIGAVTYPQHIKSLPLSEFIDLLKRELRGTFTFIINQEIEEVDNLNEKILLLNKAKRYSDTYQINIYYE